MMDFARCALCGGPLAAHSRQHGHARANFYGCTTCWKKGKSRCTNNLAARLEVLDAEVLATLHDDILRPTVVEQAITLALDELTPAGRDRTRESLEVEIHTIERECQCLADAIGRGGRLDVLLRTLEDRQRRLNGLRQQLATIHTTERPTFDARAMEGRLRDLVNDWRGLLTRDVSSGREMLKTLLVEPLRFTPIIEERRRGYAFEGALDVDDRLMADLIAAYRKVADRVNGLPSIPLTAN